MGALQNAPIFILYFPINFLLDIGIVFPACYNGKKSFASKGDAIMDPSYHNGRMPDIPAPDSLAEAAQFGPGEPNNTVPAEQYAALAKAYFELEQAYAAAILDRSREKALEEELVQTRAILADVLTSLSWRVTAPIRKLKKLWRRSHGT